MRRNVSLGNLCADGYSECARRVYRKARGYASPLMVLASDTGLVITRETHGYLPSIDPSQFVGTYDRTSDIREIEDDCLYRLQEINRSKT